ncbi:28184_t:CDS:2, partial [Racocetra persica]
NNQLSEVEIKNCPNLKEVIASHNKLNELKIEDCPEITDLYTSYNELTELDEREKLNRLGLPEKRKKGKRFSWSSFREFFKEFIKNKENKQKATEIDISNLGSRLGSRKKKLEIKNYPNLTHLNVDNCNLKELKIKNCPELKTLSFRFNQIQEIDLSGLPNLEALYCSGNKIEKLDLSNNPELKHLVCDNNPITKLELKHLKDLESLYCFKCYLEELDCSGLKNLKEVYCANNNGCLEKITGLTTCENLIELDCAENSLTELDISGLKNLEFVSCKECRLDLFCAKGCGNLTYLDYSIQKVFSPKQIAEIKEVISVPNIKVMILNLMASGPESLPNEIKQLFASFEIYLDGVSDINQISDLLISGSIKIVSELREATLFTKEVGSIELK